MSNEQYFSPEQAEGQFHCPHCGVFSKQYWAHIEAKRIWSGYSSISNATSFQEDLDRKWTISKCEHCKEKSFWLGDKMIYPKILFVEQPNQDLNEEIKEDYLEAANVLNDSPRSAAAILRLALQKLCKQLGEKGRNINDDIGELVKKGLNPTIQKSLDVLRITGNNAVHPGELNLKEDRDRVLKLFRLINFIAEKMITEPKEIDGLYQDLPENSKKDVEKRDGK